MVEPVKGSLASVCRQFMQSDSQIEDLENSALERCTDVA